MKQIFLCQIALLISLSAFGKECKPNGTPKDVDLSQYYGSVRDQGDLGWCYAYSGSDLVTGHLRKHFPGAIGPNDEDRISPADSAIHFNQFSLWVSGKRGKMKQNEASAELLMQYLEVGQQIDALEAEMKTKCPVGKKCKATKEDNEKLKALKAERKELKKKGASVELFFEGGFAQKVVKNITDKGYCQDKSIRLDHYYSRKTALLQLLSGSDEDRCFMMENTFPELRHFMEDFDEILSNRDYQQALYEMASKACERLTTPDLKTGMRFWPERYLRIKTNGKPPITNFVSKRLNKLLDEGKAAEISIFPDFLTNPPDEPVKIGKSSGEHSVLITGKKWNSETCRYDYIMRNSWGGCLNYENSKYGNIPYDCSMKFTGPDAIKDPEVKGYLEQYYKDNPDQMEKLKATPASPNDDIVSVEDKERMIKEAQQTYDQFKKELDEKGEVVEERGSLSIIYGKGHLVELEKRLTALKSLKTGKPEDVLEYRKSKTPTHKLNETCMQVKQKKIPRFSKGVSCEGDGKLTISGDLIEQYTFGMSWIK